MGSTPELSCCRGEKRQQEADSFSAGSTSDGQQAGKSRCVTASGGQLRRQSASVDPHPDGGEEPSLPHSLLWGQARFAGVAHLQVERLQIPFQVSDTG